MKENRPYSFNGKNFPKTVYSCTLVTLPLAKEIYGKAKEGNKAIINFTGLINANIAYEDACVYFRTNFVFPYNKCTDKNGVLIT